MKRKDKLNVREVYDQKIEIQKSKYHEKNIRNNSIPSGTYFLKIEIDGRAKTKTIIKE